MSGERSDVRKRLTEEAGRGVAAGGVGERVAAVLAEHVQVAGFDEVGQWHAYGCDCSFSGTSDADYRAHVAAALAPLVQEACDTAAADALGGFAAEVARQLAEAVEDGAEGEELRDRMVTGVETLLTCHFCGAAGLPPCCEDDADSNVGADRLRTDGSEG